MMRISASRTAADSLSEEQLAVLAQTGCAASFDQLVRHLQVPLVQFLGSRTRCRADAEDLAQESFVRAYRALDRYDSRCRFRTWLFTIAHRLSMNRRRGQGRTAHIVEPDSVCSSAADAADVLAEDESREGIWRVTAETLDAEQTAALWLYYVEEMSTHEIGRVLGRSRAAAKTMLFRARKRLMPALRRLLGNADDHTGKEAKHIEPRSRKDFLKVAGR